MTRLDVVGTTGGKATVESIIPDHSSRKATKPLTPVKMRQAWYCQYCRKSGEVIFGVTDGPNVSWLLVEEAHRKSDDQCSRVRRGAGLYVKTAIAV